MNGSATSARRLLVVLAAASLLATACGSTAQNAGTGGGGDVLAGPGAGAEAVGEDGLSVEPGTEGAGLGAPGTADAGSSGDITTGSGSGGGASGSGSTGGTAQAPPAGGAAPPAASGSGGDATLGPGTTATTIKLGIPYCNDCAAANGAIVAGQESPGDTRRYYQAAIDDVNARGGVLGRKLVPVFHEVSASQNIDASSQAACETFTKDNQVAAMFHRGEVIYQCALKAGVFVRGVGGSGPVFDRYPNLFTPSTARLERVYAATVRAMVKAGWHKPDTKWPTGKIGLITWESPEYQYAMKNGYLKAMHELGLEETDVRYVAPPQNASSIADASAAISSAVLAFRQKGVDHVFIGDGPAGIFAGAGLTLLFLQNAKSQSYQPRYGFNSNNAPDFESHPKDQLEGMIAIDAVDTEASNDEGIRLNPQRERCLDLMRKKSLNVGDELTSLLALNACEIAWFSEAVFSKAGGTSLAKVIPGGEALGTSYRSPLTYGTRFGPGEHDGVYLYRNLRWDTGCECTKYTSAPYEP